MLLYQSAVFNSQVRQTSLVMTDVYFEIEDSATGDIDLTDNNEGFTGTVWYKCGNVIDCTILHQNKNCDQSAKPNLSSDKENQVDNSKIIFNLCLIKPTNPDFFADNTSLYQYLHALKFDVIKICIWHKLSNSWSWGIYKLTDCF